MSKHFFRKYLELDFKISAIKFFLNILSDSSIKSFILKKYPYLTFPYDCNLKLLLKFERGLSDSLMNMRSREISNFTL